VNSKGWIDRADLYRMLKTIYGMFERDSQFHKLVIMRMREGVGEVRIVRYLFCYVGEQFVDYC
jgi:hypothetical protein